MILVVDTNIFIDFSRGNSSSTHGSLLKKLVNYAKINGHQLVMPSVALFEFLSGSEMNSDTNRQKANILLLDVRVVDVTRAIAEIAASLFRVHKATIGVIDYMLAATAISLNAEYVTLNIKHFRHMKNLRLFDFSQLS
ncbi:MAG: hypothetical protein ACD_48C00235G0001 [uncultured bacterium]|nr:MAG: hypothetical protein ACD_48C00235G0001 [uncultured bacterium]